MRVLIDDQLSLLTNLGVLEVPAEIERPLLTVYGFQLRVASAVTVERTTEGTLQRLLRSHLTHGVDPISLVRAESSALRVIDPTQLAAEIARARSDLRCNSLAAEVVAAARSEQAHVRLTPGNAKGQLFETLTLAGVPVEVWTLMPSADGLRLHPRR